MVKTLLIAALASVAVVLAQTPPDVTLIPSACSDQCASTIEVGYLCAQQFPNDNTLLAGCFCNATPAEDDLNACGSCLGENNAAAIQSALSSAAAACPTAIQQCFFQCSFDTCPQDDVACQCSAEYLENIFNCASCNTANGNTGATQIGDFNSLQESCANQNYTGASTDFTTSALPSPTGQDAYTAPVLTGTGGGAAATGSVSASGVASSAASSVDLPKTISSAAPSASSAASSGGLRSSVSSKASSATGAASAAAASATPSGAASAVNAPAALGALVAVAGLFTALF